MTVFRAVDPATERGIREVGEHDAAAVERRLALAHHAFGAWRATSLPQRAAVLRAAAERLRDNADAHAQLMQQEMGKPLAEGAGESRKCAWVCDHYAEHAEAFLQPELLPSDASRSYVRLDPIGPVLGIMPWNFPFWQVFRFLAPALMAGNVMLLKHAPGTPGCALAIEKLMADAGLPAGCLQNLFIDTDRVQGVIADRRVAAITLTGSSRAGSAVAAAAGRHLKKCVLELGGSDPFIVLDDADVVRAAQVGAASRCLNGGQSCIAAKRFIVHRSVHDAFVDALAEQMAASEMGPLARADLRDQLHQQVLASVQGGAIVRLGGELPPGNGWFYPATVLTGVTPDLPCWRDETFGPVAAVMAVPDAPTAIAVANDSIYGLGASVWTTAERGERMAASIDAGAVFVNGMTKSDPRLPFGGIKDSGWGRELSWHGLREFVNQKTVWVG